MPGLDDFDRYVDQHGTPQEHYRAAFALYSSSPSITTPSVGSARSTFSNGSPKSQAGPMPL